jgi:lysophospholipase L1-like esterase
MERLPPGRRRIGEPISLRQIGHCMKTATLLLLVAATFALFAPTQSAAAEQMHWKLDFGAEALSGYTRVTPDSVFTSEMGYGFEGGSSPQFITRGGADKLRDGFVTSDSPFLFSVAVPEGVYRVTVVLGDTQGESITTVKAEARRLMLEKVQSANGPVDTRTFLVAVKRPELKSGGRVTLKPVELDGHRDWDDKLTIEFSNARPCLCALEIAPAENFTTVFIAGDSTVTNQRNEPWGGWGQMLPRFFNDSVVVSNHAHSGLALFSFERQRRLEKVLSTLNQGDYLFIQFGHNDQKDKSPGAGPFTTYKANLKRFIEVTRRKGGIPVLVTPMERRRFAENGHQGATLADYADATRQAGAENKVPVIDLNAMSLRRKHVPRAAESIERRHAPQRLRRLRAGALRRQKHQGKPAGTCHPPRERHWPVRPCKS